MPNASIFPLRRMCQSLAREPLRAMSDGELLAKFAAGSESAFAAIVERHGPLVRAVCRRTVRDDNLADDAFQAVFVLLARKSRSLRRPEALAGWLFGAARQIAWRTRRGEARLRRREQAAASQHPEAAEPKPWDDLLQVLDEELNRLPPRLRAPLVACYLEGRTQDEAARELGWPLITLRRRLAAGREQLRLRMVRRGATLSAGLFAAALTPGADAGISASLAETTLRHSLAALHGDAIPPAIAELARETAFGGVAVAKLWLVPMVAACALVGVGMFKPWSQQPLKAMPADKPSEKPKEVLRDRFNDPLPEGAVARLGTMALKHGSGIDELRFAPDSKSVYSTGGGVIRQWQLDSGNEMRAIDMRQPPPDGVRAQGISPDGRIAVVIIGDVGLKYLPPGAGSPATKCRCEVWNPKSMTKLHEFTINEQDGKLFEVEDVKLSPGCNYIAVNRSRMNISVWDCSKSKLAFETDGWTQILTFSADDRFLITCDQEFRIDVRETATGRVVKRLGGNESRPIVATLSPDARWLATYGQTLRRAKPNENGFLVTPDSFIRLWDMENPEVVQKIQFGLRKDKPWEIPNTLIRLPLAFAPDAKSLLVLSWEEPIESYSVRRYQIPSGKLLDMLPIDSTELGPIAISPNGKTVAVGRDSGRVRLWDLEKKRELFGVDGHSGWISSLEFDGNKERLKSREYSRLMIEWNLETARPIRRVVVPNPPENGIWFGKGRYRVGAGIGVDSNQSRMIAMDVDEMRTLRDFGPGPAELSWAAVTDDGKQLVTISGAENNKQVQTWNVASGELMKSWTLKKATYIPFSTFRLLNSRRLVADDGELTIFDTATGKVLAKFEKLEKDKVDSSAPPMVATYFSEDGAFVACLVINQHEIALRETTSGRVVKRIGCRDLAPWPVAFSPDGKFFAACSRELTSVIHIWDIKSGKELHQFKGHRGDISCLAFRQDGKRLASGSADGTVLIWDLTGK